MMKRLLLWAALLIVAIQFFPYGRDHSNPQARQEPAWDRPETRALAKRACFDCHSNETRWPWYSSVAPFSWVTQSDVEEGRAEVNFSEWSKRKVKDEELEEVVTESEMPLASYLLLHPDAKLSASEREALAAGFRATIAGQAPTQPPDQP